MIAGAKLQRMVLARFADRMLIHEDVCLFRGGVDGEFAVLRRAKLTASQYQ
jgi:hypothetical protein